MPLPLAKIQTAGIFFILLCLCIKKFSRRPFFPPFLIKLDDCVCVHSQILLLCNTNKHYQVVPDTRHRAPLFYFDFDCVFLRRLVCPQFHGRYRADNASHERTTKELEKDLWKNEKILVLEIKKPFKSYSK